MRALGPRQVGVISVGNKVSREAVAAAVLSWDGLVRVAAVAGVPPLTIPLDADAIDLEDRAAHLSKVFDALSVYLAVILDLWEALTAVNFLRRR